MEHENFDFPYFHTLGIIIPTDFHIFQRGGSTTNQIAMYQALQTLYSRWRSSLGIKVLEEKNLVIWMFSLDSETIKGVTSPWSHSFCLRNIGSKTTQKKNNGTEKNNSTKSCIILVLPYIQESPWGYQGTFCWEDLLRWPVAGCLHSLRSLFANHILWWHKIHTIHHYWPPLLA